MSASSRPTWDDTWMIVAQTVGARSLCDRQKVGAVIVTAENRIVSVGYNGPPAGFDHQSLPCVHWCTRGCIGPTKDTLASYADCPSLHAESNALSVCDRTAREGGTLYVTGAMCYTCAKLVANSGLARAVVVDEGDRRMYRDPLRSLQLLRQSGVAVHLWAP